MAGTGSSHLAGKFFITLTQKQNTPCGLHSAGRLKFFDHRARQTSACQLHAAHKVINCAVCRHSRKFL